MTIQVIESWKTYAATAEITRRWPYQLGNGGALNANGCLLNGSTVSYCNAHMTPQSAIRMGFWFTPVQRAPSVTNSSCLHLCVGGESNSFNQIGLGHNPDGTMSCFRAANFSGLGGTTLANGTTVLALNTAYWLELSIDGFGSAKTIELRINGATEFLLTGQNTNPQASPWIDRVALVAGASAQYVFGALYIGDGADGWLGPSNVQRLQLTGDTAQADLTPNAGTTHYTQVNDLDTSTTYVQSSTQSAADLYTIAAATYQPASITALQVDAVGVNQTALTQALAPLVKTGATTKSYAAALPATSYGLTWYKTARTVRTADNAGNPWTFANLSSVQVGARIAPFAKGFNFRATSGGFTDAASDTNVLGDLYPTVRGGVTFGWDSAPTTLDSASYPYGGLNYVTNSGTQRTFRIDVPAAGRYQLRLMVSATSANANQYAVVKDGSTTLFTLNPAASVPHCMDAAGATPEALASWPEFNTPRVITLAGTALNITIGTPTSSGGTTALAHVELIALDAGTPAVTANQLNVAGLYVEALISTAAAAAGSITVTQGTLTVAQSGTGTIGSGLLSATATGDTASQTTFTVNAAPAHGTLKVSGSPASTWTQDDINNNRLTYTQNGDAVTTDSFTFHVSAPGDVTTGTLTFHINVTLSGGGGGSGTITVAAQNPLFIMRWDTEDVFDTYLSAATSLGTAASAITFTVTTAPAYGTLQMGGVQVSSFTQANLNNGLLFYTQNGTAAAFDSFVVTVSATNCPNLPGVLLGIFIEDLGFHFSSAAVGTCPTTVVDEDCETATVAADCETSDLPGCCA